jgi:osmoprotectant transport system substrate-binding protein
LTFYDGQLATVTFPSRTLAMVAALVAGALVALALAACGSGGRNQPVATDGPVTPAATTTTTTTDLPGTNKPAITIGDKNFTEQFILGELYAEALSAAGYNVSVNRNIGPTDVTISALRSGRISMYPEYIGVWDSSVAGIKRGFRTGQGAYQAGRKWADANGFQLMNATPFDDKNAIAVTLSYAAQNRLRTIKDLRRVAQGMTLGSPPQLYEGDSGLAGIEQAYGFAPAAVKSLDVGAQYFALTTSQVQAADVNTTDGQLASGDYVLLSDPQNVFGWGQVVPVVSAKVMAEEGPAFGATINAVSALLTTKAMRWLNAEVDLAHENPTSVAQQFLVTHGLIPPDSDS